MFSTYNPYNFVAIAGTKDFKTGGISYKIRYKITYDDYPGGETWYMHDIGLLKTDEVIEFNDKVQSLQLPDQDPLSLNPLPTMVFAGWGSVTVSSSIRNN